LFVVGNFVAGGAERHLLELWSRMDRERFEIEIACFGARGSSPPRSSVTRLADPRARRVAPDLRSERLARLPAVDPRRARLSPPRSTAICSPNLFAVLAGRLCGVPAVLVAKRNVDAFETKRQAWLQSLVHRWATHVTAVSENVAETVVNLGVPRER
jgi:hypothetical protein